MHLTPIGAGLVLAAGSCVGVGGSLLGGFLVDHYGRRAVAIGSIGLGVVRMVLLTQVHSLALGLVVICFGELVVNAYEPAVGALIADLAPEGRLAEAYGLRRAAGQAGWVIGPLVGGLAARSSYDLLFLCSAAMLAVSTIVAFFILPHGRGATVSRSAPAHPLVALRDRRFLAYTLAALVPLLLIGWYEGVTPVALRESRGVDTGTWGTLLVFGALCAVVFQVPVARLAERYSPFRAIAAGCACLGAGMLGFASGLPVPLLAGACGLVTLGQMLIVPTASALASRLAPAHLQGTYQGLFFTAMTLAFGIGPFTGLWLLEGAGADTPSLVAPIVAAAGVVLVWAALRAYRTRAPGPLAGSGVAG
jgi:MFS family permease